jgi:site-specific DNA-methyltransferase (adenine-specific)/modification methylase
LSRVETIAEGVTIYCGDCREILPTLGKVDAVVTDPPYGIQVDKNMSKQGGTRYGVAAAAKRQYDATDWDYAPPRWLLDQLRDMSTWQIVFGGNYFDLPPSRCWLVWDKKVNGEFADCELAWTNLEKPVRRIEWMWNGMLRRGGESRSIHPTQKPLEVMRWCLAQLPDSCELILDPFMGSGTTGMAAVKLGKKFIGIERHQPYFDLACQRIAEALKQPDLLVAAAEPAKQTALFEPTP